MFITIFRIDKNNEKEQTTTSYSDMDVTYKYDADQKKADTEAIQWHPT